MPIPSIRCLCMAFLAVLGPALICTAVPTGAPPGAASGSKPAAVRSEAMPRLGEIESTMRQVVKQVVETAVEKALQKQQPVPTAVAEKVLQKQLQQQFFPTAVEVHMMFAFFCLALLAASCCGHRDRSSKGSSKSPSLGGGSQSALSADGVQTSEPPAAHVAGGGHPIAPPPYQHYV